MSASPDRVDRVVLVGAGLGGLRTAEALRSEGFEGTIVLLGNENELPYDRPPLSKDFLRGERPAETLYLRTRERIDELGVELLLGRTAHRLDLATRSVETDGGSVAFDALVIATGASPRTLPVFAAHSGIHTLRTLTDSRALRQALGWAQHVTVIGAGFIGSEVAASARRLGRDVAIIELEATPLARAVGPEAGEILMQLHRDNATDLRLGVTVTSVGGDEVKRLRLSDGTILETDVVVVGVGVTPNVGWLAGGLVLADGVICDRTLNAGAPGVFAIGDVANWPNGLLGRRMRVEHWTNTADQARHVARNLVRGTRKPFEGSNYVWSDQYGVRIQFVGDTHAKRFTIVAGSVDEREFLGWYCNAERLVGAVAIGMPKLLMASKRFIEARWEWRDALEALAGEKRSRRELVWDTT